MSSRCSFKLEKQQLFPFGSILLGWCELQQQWMKAGHFNFPARALWQPNFHCNRQHVSINISGNQLSDTIPRHIANYKESFVNLVRFLRDLEPSVTWSILIYIPRDLADRFLQGYYVVAR